MGLCVGRILAAVVLVLFGAATATAQNYPNRTVRIIVGPSSDLSARVIAERLQQQLGQSFVVENRGGGGGEVAAKAVSSSDPDGYTLLYATSSYTLNTALQLATYDFVKDFEPVALLGISSFTLVVPPSLPAKTLGELITLAKEKPGSINCASSGVGTPAHLGCEMFGAMTGAKIAHVPFKDVNAAVNAMVSGYVQMLFAVSSNANPQVESGTLRGLAITTAERSKLYPKLPTMRESGLPEFIITGWGSIVAPAGTPKPVIDTLNKSIVGLLRDPDIRDRIAQTGQEPTDVEDPEQFAAFIRNDVDRWNRVIDQAGIKRGRPQTR